MTQSIKYYQIALSVKVESPFIFASTSTISMMVDTALLRNPAGQLILPGSQLRGVVRDLFKRAGWDDLCGSIFGGEGSGDAFDEALGGSEAFAPNRRLVYFNDLALQDDGGKEHAFTTRIAINPETGSTKTGSLQIIEMPYPMGQEVTFSGSLDFIGTQEQASDFQKKLKNVMPFLRSIGGAKTAGFGVVTGYDIQEIQEAGATRDANDIPPLTGEHIAIDFTLSRPFLINSKRVGSNVFEGAHTIPGGVFKGAYAAWRERCGTMDDNTSTALGIIRFRHAPAMMADATDRPRVVPASFYTHNNDSLYDYFAQGEDWQTHAEQGSISFSPDWKGEDWQLISKCCQTPEPPGFWSTTHTKIGDDGKSDDGNLFVYRCVNPEGYKWRLIIDRNGADIGAFQQIVRNIQNHALWPLGKTNVGAVGSNGCSIDAPKVSKLGNSWRITLQSEANLIGHNEAAGKTLDKAAAYRSYWEKAARQYEANITSLDFMAIEVWQGGYLSRRFKDHNKEGYSPYLITQAGAVFILEIDGDGAAGFMDDMARGGLLPDGIKKDTRDPWEITPFARENGFGEVAIDSLDVDTLAKFTTRRA